LCVKKNCTIDDDDDDDDDGSRNRGILIRGNDTRGDRSVIATVDTVYHFLSIGIRTNGNNNNNNNNNNNK